MPLRERPLVEQLLAQQYTALLAFFGRRTRRAADVSDLVQETYLRMLRVSDPESIQNPEGYLFTVAANLLKENAVIEGRFARSVAIESAELDGALAHVPAFDEAIDGARHQARLRVVLDQLSPKCRAAVVLQYQHGWTYQQIAAHLGVSTHMVKKHLAHGLAHCRRRMASLT